METIGTPGDKILRALGRYYALLPDQLRRVTYNTQVIGLIQNTLKALWKDHYVIRQPYGDPLVSGRNPFVYQLGPEGVAYLAARGIDTYPRYRPVELTRRNWGLTHTLAANDVLIRLEVQGRTDPRLAVDTLYSEQFLKRYRQEVDVPVECDGWAVVHSPTTTHTIALELDRHSEFQRKWRAKVAALDRALADSPAEVAVVIQQGGERRCQQLCAWTRAQLLGSSTPTPFLFTVAEDPTTVDFAASVWRTPYEPTLQPFLAGVS